MNKVMKCTYSPSISRRGAPKSKTPILPCTENKTKNIEERTKNQGIHS